MFNSPNKSVGVINGVPDFPADGNDYVFQGDNTWKVLPPPPGKNLIINGAMNIAQRGTQKTGVTAGGHKTVDRSFFNISSLGTWTVDQSTDAPNGFSNSHKITCTTADASPAASDYVLHSYYVEAQDLQHLAYGTADAKTMTISFWVKSNKTGAASYAILQIDNSNKMFSAGYTINSADTWEYKTILIPADIAGVINNDNGTGLNMGWWLNTGSDFTGGSFTGSWVSEDSTRKNPSNLGVGGAVNDYFAITGVQLEVGDEATEFEHEDYGTTLLKCLRYYYLHDVSSSNHNIDGFRIDGVASGRVEGSFKGSPIPMRDTPALSYQFAVNSGVVNPLVSIQSPSNGTTLRWQFDISGASPRQININKLELDAEL